MNYLQYNYYLKGLNGQTIAWLRENGLDSKPYCRDEQGNLLNLYECKFEFLEFIRESAIAENYLHYKTYRRSINDPRGRVKLLQPEAFTRIKAKRFDLTDQVTTAAAAKVLKPKIKQPA